MTPRRRVNSYRRFRRYFCLNLQGILRRVALLPLFTMLHGFVFKKVCIFLNIAHSCENLVMGTEFMHARTHTITNCMYQTGLVRISRPVVTIRTEGFNIKKKVYFWHTVLLMCSVGSNNMIHRADWSFSWKHRVLCAIRTQFLYIRGGIQNFLDWCRHLYRSCGSAKHR
jgi:hypothetical protein